LLGTFDDAQQNDPLSVMLALMGNGGHTRRIFIELWPWKLDVSAPQFGDFLGEQSVSLQEKHSPGRPGIWSVSGIQEGAKVHLALNRHTWHPNRESHQITDKSS
jgi:hypothetical protein